jgi:hypothetical protein
MGNGLRALLVMRSTAEGIETNQNPPSEVSYV